jgi:hypothetical protein
MIKAVMWLVKVVFILFAGIIVSLKSNAQQRHLINNSPLLNINNYEVLPDNGYSFSNILHDTSLLFKQDSLRKSKSGYYWIKLDIINPYPNNEPYILSMSSPFSYVLYIFDIGKNKWVGRPSGLNVVDGERKSGLMRLNLLKQASNTIYLKIEIQDIHGLTGAIKPAIILEKEYTFSATEHNVYSSYILCCIALICFSLYNLYLFWGLKDKTYLYYVIAQLGAMIYLSGSFFIFNLVLPVRISSMTLRSDGIIGLYDINIYFVHVGTAIIFWGFMQFTRLYLRTKKHLPDYDILLKLLAYAYLLLETVFPTITLISGYLMDTVYVANFLILVIVFAAIITGLVAHNRGIRVARPFLLANLLPMIFVVGTSISILNKGFNILLPVIAILSQILTFGIALIGRFKIINDGLKAKELEAVKLEKDITVIKYQRLLTEEENKTIALTVAFEKERNALLQQQLEANQRELVGNSLYIHQKNKLLADLKTHVGDLKQRGTSDESEVFKNIRSSLNGGDYLDEEWDKFKLHFEQVHPRFFKELQASHPILTRYELRLYAYFHINLSTKEIAALLNIAPASVRQAKMRLNKKMGQ